MFFKKKKSEPTRTVERFDELQVGDLLTFKFRAVLPEGLSGETLMVESINAYDYAGTLVADFGLSHASGLKVNATYDVDEDAVTLSHKIKHPEIIEIFDGDQLAAIFDPAQDFATLQLRSESVSEQRSAWMCNSYTRTLCEAQAYYYDQDRRELGISEYADDGSVPFTYHELQGESDNHSMSIEVWEDGETEFFAEVTVAATAVETFLPNG